MFQPQIQFTHTIAGNLETVEEIRRLINSIPVLPSWEMRIRRDALVNTVFSTAAIEGNRLTRRQVERIFAGQKVAADEKDTVEIRNLIPLMNHLYHLAHEAVQIDEGLIRDINKRILQGVPGAEVATPGEYRKGQNYVQERPTGRIIYTPPNQGDVPALMSQFAKWLQLDYPGMSPILKAGIAHLEFVAIHPFWDGNGRTARAVATYLMYRTGYHFRRFHSWETYLNADVTAYSSAIGASLGDHYYHRPRDYTAWLEYFTNGLATTLSALRREIEALRRAWDTAYDAGSKLGFDQSQVQALAFASYYGAVTTDIYRQALQVSRATAYRHLKELEEAGLLRKIGRGRACHYVPVDSIAAIPVPQPRQAEVTTTP